MDRRRRVALVALVATIALFVVELVAIALGWFTVAVVCALVFFAGWFVLRSFVKRQERREAAPPG